ncbi:Arc family DNA-binding protein [Morganella morganii]|uniref:Arc family DNA-binding protein n=1 Tax=Morganella morganii TaxID=582 RepID=UPI003750EAE9
MNDQLYTCREKDNFMLRMPKRMKDEIKHIAEMDGISINSAIVQRLARSLREERTKDAN